jgi:hypothetical protein
VDTISELANWQNTGVFENRVPRKASGILVVEFVRGEGGDTSFHISFSSTNVDEIKEDVVAGM